MSLIDNYLNNPLARLLQPFKLSGKKTKTYNSPLLLRMNPNRPVNHPTENIPQKQLPALDKAHPEVVSTVDSAVCSHMLPFGYCTTPYCSVTNSTYPLPTLCVSLLALSMKVTELRSTREAGEVSWWVKNLEYSPFRTQETKYVHQVSECPGQAESVECQRTKPDQWGVVMGHHKEYILVKQSRSWTCSSPSTCDIWIQSPGRRHNPEMPPTLKN